ncbi:hypothetical protein [Anabaena subtropica]|nr:hypothetical protein [Anabaena subtropica]
MPIKVLQNWQTTPEFVNQSVHSVVDSAQQLGQSLQETATQTTDKAVRVVTTTIDHAKGYLDQNLQAADQFKSTTSTAMQTAIASSVNDLLVQHPTFLRLLQILGWATNHPIISLVILLFIIAFIWSIIKAIMRLIETASWSIFQVPLKLIQGLIKVGIFSFSKVGTFAIQKINNYQTINDESHFSVSNNQIIFPDKQQRLNEIFQRLEAIQQEQRELLQEAKKLIPSDTIEITLPEVKFTRSQI